MRSVGIKLLKNRLREYIRLAAGGETVLVTDRDRAVVSSRLLEREVWNRINARRLQPVKRRQIAAKPECPPRPS